MSRIAGRIVYQKCTSRETLARIATLPRAASYVGRGFSADAGGGSGGESRLVEVSTKEQFVDFPRYAWTAQYSCRVSRAQ